MKESSGKTKKPSKGVRRARSMRNVVMMVLVCVLMLSAATYAWFTLSKNAKVANLTMTVGEKTSLLIAPDIKRGSVDGEAGEYGSSLSFGTEVKDAKGSTTSSAGTAYDYYEIDGALLPATLSTDGNVYKPQYDEPDDGTIVTGFEATDEILTDNIIANSVTTIGAGDYYCYKTTFYLKTAGEDVDVRLKSLPDNNGMTAILAPTSGSGTYIINAGETPGQGAAALRIRLSATKEDRTVESIVYEPLSDCEISGTTEKATLKAGVNEEPQVTITDKQSSTGKFTQNEGKITVTSEGTRVTLEIWVEGSDKECVNQIMANQIEGVLAFEVVPTT